ncbi:MAG: 2-dehydro-3-deoxy-D-gluconate 5-dehydrogenase KduD [Gemmatimonadetes bacterium]|nr:2-dehydro-3-deoxy-D-gluconate 5-dehydrogenase KduD [Gemmatimonadota bacterium]
MPELSLLTDRFSLTGRRALVTGASRGLGRAIAEALAQFGADVALVDREDSAEPAAAVRAAGHRAWQFTADLSVREELQRLIEQVDRDVGGIDILVNNAGIIRRAPAVDYPVADWDLVLRTNLDAVFLLCQHFGRRMVQRGRGKIINIASLLAFSGGINIPAYTASKSAVAGLTRAFANEWTGRGVQVNAIAPGYFDTENTRPLRENPGRQAEISARIPAGRWGDPRDLAGPVVFLASAASDYVSGHILVVDGGWMAR